GSHSSRRPRCGPSACRAPPSIAHLVKSFTQYPCYTASTDRCAPTEDSMRTSSRSRRPLAVALGIAFASAIAVWQPVAAQTPRERTMFVSAVDQKGEPVEGLGPNDFVIREDGAAREVLRVSRAIEPIDIAILVDDSAASASLIPRAREALRSFIARMSMGNQIAIVGLADRPTILANYT